ncbi:MAG: SurA N-terminal domain-containing protein, partial [Bdellovibrionales bacterium]|nr:SurA N-terminal domain-containing protein [Bdellovibrionales bacterium]
MHLFQSLLFLTRYALVLAFGCLLMVPLLHPVPLLAQESDNPPTKSSGQLVDASKLPRPGSAPAGLDNQAPPTDPNTVIAKFDSSSITLGDVDQQLKMRPGAQEFFQNAPPELVRKVRLGALNSLVDRELLFKEAKKNGVAIDDKVLVENVNQVLQQFGPDETQRNERMSAFGLTQEELKKQIGIDLTIKGYIEKFVGKDTAITEQEVKATFDAHPSAYNTPKAVKISHILITVPQNADEASENAAKKKIDEIYKEAQGK